LIEFVCKDKLIFSAALVGGFDWHVDYVDSAFLQQQCTVFRVV
jgi:hypothetical protein